MPNNPADITIYKDLAEKGNYDAIIELATDSFSRAIYDEPGSVDEKAEFDAFLSDLVSHEPGEPVSKKNANIYKNILAAFNEKAAANAAALEKEIRENEKRIANGEISELSLMNGEPKKVRKAAEAFTFSQTVAGIKQQAYAQMHNSIHLYGPDDPELNNEINGNDDLNLINNIKSKLKSELNIPDDILNNTELVTKLSEPEFSRVEEYYFSQKPVDAGEKVITATDSHYEDFKKMSNAELVKKLAKKEKEYEEFKEVNKEMLELADDAGELMKAISGIRGFDNSSKAASDFTAEVKNLTKYGTDECTFENSIDIYNNKTIRVSSNLVIPVTYKKAISMLKKAAESLRNEYAGQDNDAAGAAEEASKKADEFVRVHEAKFKSISKSYSKDMKNPEHEIFLIKQEQSNRMMFSEDHKALAKECHEREQKVMQIGRYIDKAQRGLDIIARAAEWLTGDKVTHGHPSASYTSFAEAMSELGQMKADSASPAELLEKMQQTYDAAVAYEQQHTGKWHPFTGITDNGKDRIRYSRLAKCVLGRKLAELRPMVEKLGPQLDGLTPGTRKITLELENDEGRQAMEAQQAELKAKAEQNKTQKQTAENFLDKQIKDAQEELRKAGEQAGQGKYPDKETVKEQYIKIITASSLKIASKRSNYVPKVENFEKLCKSEENSPVFKSFFNSRTSEQIFKDAVAKEGQQLFHDYVQVRTEIRKAAANAKDDKAAPPVNVKEKKGIGAGPQ